MLFPLVEERWRSRFPGFMETSIGYIRALGIVAGTIGSSSRYSLARSGDKNPLRREWFADAGVRRALSVRGYTLQAVRTSGIPPVCWARPLQRSRASVGAVGVFRRAWEKPPSSFHRFIAASPVRWVAIVVGVIVVPGAGTMRDYNGFEWAVFGALTVSAALAALVGGLLTRRRVTQYDARAGQ